MSDLDPVALLRELVRIPSVSGDEAALADWIADWCEEQGLACARRERNLVITVGTPGGQRLLLNSHLDTVPAVPGWSTAPHAPPDDPDRVQGLGANDAKGCGTAMLCALLQHRDTGLAGEVVLALTVEEEVGDQGLEALVPKLGEFDAAVIGEPTNLDVCRAQKGLVWLEVETSGTARHAAHAHRLPGNNAVLEAAQAIAALEGWHPDARSELLGPATCQITQIQGGTQRNVIPEQCTFILDVRTVPGLETDELVQEIELLTGASVSVLEDKLKPFETAADAAIVQVAQQVRPTADVIGSATLSDACWTRRWPTIKVGPGRTERSHTADEFVTREELEAGVAFYSGLIETFL